MAQKKNTQKKKTTNARRVARPVAKKRPVAKRVAPRKRSTVVVRPARTIETVEVREYKPMVGPIAAIRNFFEKYFDVFTRSTRSEFWFGALFVLLVNTTFSLYVGGFLAMLVWAILFIPMISLIVRRFRDAGISVWLFLIPCLIFYAVPVFYLGQWLEFWMQGYVSSGMMLYSLFSMVYVIMVLIVAGFLPSQK